MEIKASELRLNNWVAMPSSGLPVQITAMDISDIQSNLKNRLGIPLTPEILLKAGFWKSKAGWYEMIPVSRFTIVPTDTDAFCIYSGYEVNGEPNLIAIVYHFHQLQNFWASCNLGELTN